MSSKLKVITEDNVNSSLIIKEIDVEKEFGDIVGTFKSGAKGMLNIAKEYTALFNYTLKAVAKIITGQKLDELNADFERKIDTLNSEFESIMNSMPATKDAAMFSFLVNPGATVGFLLTNKEVLGKENERPTKFLRDTLPMLQPGIDLGQAIYAKIYKSITGNELDFKNLSKEDKQKLKIFNDLIENLEEPAKSMIKNINGSNAKKFIETLNNYQKDKSDANKKELQKYLKLESTVLTINNLILEENRQDSLELIDSFIKQLYSIITPEALQKIFGEDFKKIEDNISIEDISESTESIRNKVNEYIKTAILFFLNKKVSLIVSRCQMLQIQNILNFCENDSQSSLTDDSALKIDTLVKEINLNTINNNPFNVVFNSEDISDNIKNLTAFKNSINNTNKKITNKKEALKYLVSAEESIDSLDELLKNIIKDKTKLNKSKEKIAQTIKNFKSLKIVAQKDPAIPDDIAESYETYMKKLSKQLENIYVYFEKQKSFVDITKNKIKNLSKQLEDDNQVKDTDLDKEDETKKEEKADDK